MSRQLTQGSQSNLTPSTFILAQLIRFVFGLKSDVKNNIFYIDDQRVLYPCGHNIVLFNIDDKKQTYISGKNPFLLISIGVEGSEGITALAVSQNRKFLAVCEKAERALCIIYDIATQKRRKILTSTDYQAKEFVSVAFSAVNEKSLLCTLTGEPDWKIILWLWDKSKCFTLQQVGVTGGATVNQCSFHNQDPNIVLVTGNNAFKYYRVQDNNSLKIVHAQILKKEAHISNHLTCHTWLPDGRLIVCTDHGEIMLFESSGDYKMLLPESPGEGFYIECIITYSKGFIIAGESGQIMIYEKSEEPKNPYHRIAILPSSSDGGKGSNQEKEYHQLQPGIMSSKIRCLGISSSEDQLIFTTENNQLMKVQVNIERPSDDSKYEYLIFPFHSRGITGMDTCIKKTLVATCSNDKTVRIWNYQTKTLEICELYPDDAYSIAFHPSGFHIIVGFTDKVRMMNIFSKKLQTYKEIPIKGCRDIKFSNGGHLFACQNTSTISVFKFFTGENPPEYNFKGHQGKVKCIQWLDDDSGFISGGIEGTSFMWRLNEELQAQNIGSTEQKQENIVFMFGNKQINISSVLNKGESKNVIFAAASDKTIKEIEITKERDKDGKYILGKEKLRYEAGLNISQIQQLHGGKAFFAGIAEMEKPGSIQVIKYPFERIFEVQAHSLPVERLRISYDNQLLFSAGNDGVFCIFDIKTKDQKKQETLQITYSDEILIQKAERDRYMADIENLKASILHMKQTSDMKTQQELIKKQQRIDGMEHEIKNKEEENRARYDLLVESKKEIERMNQEKIETMIQSHVIEMEKRKQEYQEKMHADEVRYQELSNQKEDESKKYNEELNQLYMTHDKIIKELQQDQKIELERQIKETERLKKQIETMMKDHKEQRENIENEAWENIDKIKERNKEELNKIIELGMSSKASLTLITNEYKESKSKKDQLQRDIHEKQTKLADQIQLTGNLKQQILSQNNELKERETTIRDKDKRIYDLKKKTQELEKFKFVLDYKIKELKRDIGPRELEIQKLNEQTNKMRQELKHFNRVNQNLALIVDDLRMRQEGLTNEHHKLKQSLDDQDSLKKKFKDDVFEVLHHITDFKKLKKGVIRLHKKYVKEEIKNEQGDTDLHREYANRRRHLENNVNYLRQMLQKDQEVHKNENSRIMKENVTLLQEINELRTEVHSLKQKLKQLGAGHELKMGSTARSQLDSMRQKGDQGQLPITEIQRQLQMQEITIDDIQKQIQEFENQNEILRNQRPRVGRLPPLDQSQIQQQQDDEDDGQQQRTQKREEDFEEEEESPMKAQRPEMEQMQQPVEQEEQSPGAEGGQSPEQQPEESPQVEDRQEESAHKQQEGQQEEAAQQEESPEQKDGEQQE